MSYIQEQTPNEIDICYDPLGLGGGGSIFLPQCKKGGIFEALGCIVYIRGGDGIVFSPVHTNGDPEEIDEKLLNSFLN